MVNATIQDKLPPTIACPPNMTVSCNDNFDLTKLASGLDGQLHMIIVKFSIVTDSTNTLNPCRIGTITRPILQNTY